MSMFRLPFGWLPGHWGLKGKTREIAKAEYELSGYDLERRLFQLKEDELDPQTYGRKSLDIELKHGKITKSKYHRALADFITDQTQRELALLELDLREGKLGEIEYQKKKATLNKEPWVTVINMHFGGKTALEGSFELDWNEFFVDKLRNEGYNGPTPDSVVNQWFMEVCRNVALEEFDGTGDFTADSAANLEAMKRWSSDSLPEGKKGYR